MGGPHTVRSHVLGNTGGAGGGATPGGAPCCTVRFNASRVMVTEDTLIVDRLSPLNRHTDTSENNTLAATSLAGDKNNKMLSVFV